ncbi:MAG TPA: prolyl oligopeptidase family serine peptidase, partial [Usitatibacter sp.]
SSLHHVKDNTAYPAVLLTTGMNDARVASWQAAKMTARLESANPNGKPVLLRVDPDAGYGSGLTRIRRDEELADIYSFLLWQMGDPAFQPGGVPAVVAPATAAVGAPVAASSNPQPETAPLPAPAEPLISQPPLKLPPSMFAPKPESPTPTPDPTSK